MWYVYILECKNENLYTGITNDLKKRFRQHVSGKGARYTRSFGVKRLVYKEKHPDRSSALKREAEIKSWTRVKKFAFLKIKN